MAIYYNKKQPIDYLWLLLFSPQLRSFVISASLVLAVWTALLHRLRLTRLNKAEFSFEPIFFRIKCLLSPLSCYYSILSIVVLRYGYQKDGKKTDLSQTEYCKNNFKIQNIAQYKSFVADSNLYNNCNTLYSRPYIYFDRIGQYH